MPTTTVSPAIAKILNTNASPRFMAILDYALDNPETRIEPRILSLTVTSDGFLQLTNANDPLRQGFVGDVENFEENLSGICDFVGLNAREKAEVAAAAWTRIVDWRTTGRKGTSPYSDGRK